MVTSNFREDVSVSSVMIALAERFIGATVDRDEYDRCIITTDNGVVLLGAEHNADHPRIDFFPQAQVRMVSVCDTYELAMPLPGTITTEPDAAARIAYRVESYGNAWSNDYDYSPAV